MNAQVLKAKDELYLIRESGRPYYCPFSKRHCGNHCPLFVLNEKKAFLMCKNQYFDITGVSENVNYKKPLSAILDDIAITFKIDPNLIKGRNKEMIITVLRHAFIYIAIVKVGHFKRDVSDFIKRHRSTLMYSIKNINNLLEIRPKEFKEVIEFIENYK